MLRLTVPLLALTLCALPAQAEIYKVVGADGKVSYTDQPPQDKAARSETLKIQTYAGAPSVSSYAGSVRKVTLLSAQWCGACKSAKAHLASRKIAYEEWDIDRSEFARAKMREIGATGVPVILVGKQKMVGFSPQGLDDMLKNAAAP